MIYKSIIPSLLLAPQLLWAAQPVASMSGQSISFNMEEVLVARTEQNCPAAGPWYLLSNVTDFALDFADGDSFTASARYCPNTWTDVTVTYEAEQGKLKVQSKDFLVEISLKFTDGQKGTADIAWHEAGDTRHFTNVPFTLRPESDNAAHVHLPMEQIGMDPNMWDDGLADILQELEKASYKGTEKLYQKRLVSLLPMIMMSYDASYTTPEYKGNTALHYACALSHVKLVQWLVDHGADLEFSTDKGASIDSCIGGRNAAEIKSILQKARAWRDAPYQGAEIDTDEAREAAAYLDVAFSGIELESPDFIIPLKEDKAEACARLVYRYVKSGNGLPSLGICTTDTPGELLIRVLNAKMSEEMFVERLLSELKQRRRKMQVVRRTEGLALALLPHMILHREEEGMPYDGASPLYRAAKEGNVELFQWLLEHSEDRRITNEQGEECELPADAPNAATIRSLPFERTPVTIAPADVAGKTFTFSAPGLELPFKYQWTKMNTEAEGAITPKKDWCVIVLQYNRTGNNTAKIVRQSEWAPGGYSATGWAKREFDLRFTSPEEGTATCTDSAKNDDTSTYNGTFTLK